MHERSLMDAILRRIQSEADAAGATRVTTVRVRVGPLFHGSAEHLGEHFAEAAHGTIAQHARLVVRVDESADTRYAQDVFLESIDLEDENPSGSTPR